MTDQAREESRTLRIVVTFRSGRATESGEPDATFALMRVDDDGDDVPLAVIRAEREYREATGDWTAGYGYKLTTEFNEIGPYNLGAIATGTFLDAQRGILNILQGSIHDQWMKAQNTWALTEEEPGIF